jgi:hypothetical protein
LVAQFRLPSYALPCSRRVLHLRAPAGRFATRLAARFRVPSNVFRVLGTFSTFGTLRPLGRPPSVPLRFSLPSQFEVSLLV